MATITYIGNAESVHTQGLPLVRDEPVEVADDHVAVLPLSQNQYFKVDLNGDGKQTERDELMAEAEALGVEFRSNIRTDTLRERVAEARGEQG